MLFWNLLFVRARVMSFDSSRPTLKFSLFPSKHIQERKTNERGSSEMSLSFRSRKELWDVFQCCSFCSCLQCKFQPDAPWNQNFLVTNIPFWRSKVTGANFTVFVNLKITLTLIYFSLEVNSKIRTSLSTLIWHVIFTRKHIRKRRAMESRADQQIRAKRLNTVQR